MHYNDLIQIYFERSNALQWLWTLYVVVIGGLLAFSSLRKQKDMVTAILVTVLFCAFAFKNMGSIGDLTMQRIAALQAVKQYPSNTDAVESKARMTIEPTLVAPDYEGIRNFHITCDILTIAALWAMELRRVKMARREELQAA